MRVIDGGWTRSWAASVPIVHSPSRNSTPSALSEATLSALGVLFREGECTIGALAAHERVQPPSMTRTVNCLVDDGYAARRPHPKDGRQVLVDLTDKGREILLADRRRRDAWLAQRLRDLTPDERALLREVAPLLQRLATSS